ncbi:WD40 repeat domain-containing protein [Candidatus Laterigemmans baculatus]|uniref:WD40 repeat domain-containing protein n=1 Tax=Candidatus Laterigemmans baculatus TaxID=2770505 RepID=UPI0013DAC452|nr:WD40 repeat domain-containing protein [Candidatus Laterigemmans baculatus]
MLRTTGLSILGICGALFGVAIGADSAWAQAPYGDRAPYDAASIRLRPVGNNTYPPVVTALAIDPRGELLAASGDDHIIRILARPSLKTLKELALHEDWVQTLDFSDDGSTLVSAGNDGQVILWDRDKNWETRQRITGAPAIRSVQFSPDGSQVAAVGFQPQLFLMGIGNAARPTLQCGCRDLRCVAFRGDGSVVAAAGRSGDIHFFDARTGSAIDEVQLHGDRIRAMQFVAQTSRIVSVCEDGHAVLYDMDAKRIIHEMQVPGCKLQTLAMVDATHVALGGTDNFVHLFNLETGKKALTLEGHTGSIAAMVGDRGELFSGSFDTTIRRWSLQKLAQGARVADAEAAEQPDARTSRRP